MHFWAGTQAANQHSSFFLVKCQLANRFEVHYYQVQIQTSREKDNKLHHKTPVAKCISTWFSLNEAM